MDQEKIIVYGTAWCGDCHMATRFLDQHQVPYQWIDISEDGEARRYVERVNNGNRSVPTILFQDGSLLVEPSARELVSKLDSLTHR